MRDSICFIYLALIWVLRSLKKADCSEDWLIFAKRSFAFSVGQKGLCSLLQSRATELAESKPLQGQKVSVRRGEVLLPITALTFNLPFVLLVLLKKLIILVYVLI